MAQLSYMEKRRFEQLLNMGGGFVLDFTNRTFADFVADSTGRDIYDARYEPGGSSKANHLRYFWKMEGGGLVGKPLGDLLDYGLETGAKPQASTKGFLGGTTVFAYRFPPA
jgi:hypothetical protein